MHLATRVDGKLVDSGKSQRFEVVPLRAGGTLPGAEPEEFAAFRDQFAELSRRVSGTRRVLSQTKTRLGAIRQTLDRSTVDGTELGDQVRAMEKRIAGMQERLSGDARRGMANDQGPVSISRRLSVVNLGTQYSVHGPTPTHRTVYAIAERELGVLTDELNRLIETELPALERRLEEAGVPWTPGRAVPAR